MYKKLKKILILMIIQTIMMQVFSLALVNPECEEKGGFSIPEEGCALLIDLDISLMTVYLNGIAYKEYPVSGGTASTPSPLGTWRVVNIDDWGEGFGGSWIGLNVPWGKYGIHGTPEPWMVGRCHDSHGCIRMKNEDVREVKKVVTYGTTVHIKQDSAPFRAMENGMVGTDVQNTQKMLIKLKFYTGSADGVFGDGMERAVRSFQKTYHLYVDGIVGRQTYNKICEQADLVVTEPDSIKNESQE